MTVNHNFHLRDVSALLCGGILLRPSIICALSALHLSAELELSWSLVSSVALHVVATTFCYGFDSFRAHHSFQSLGSLGSILIRPIVSFLWPYWTRWLATAATSSMFGAGTSMVVVTVVCPMTFMTANRFLFARYVPVPKP
jgi:hypothetical protein